jgi:hypothetical protein
LALDSHLSAYKKLNELLMIIAPKGDISVAPCEFLDLDEETEVQESVAGDIDDAIEQHVSSKKEPDKQIDKTLFNNFWLNEIKAQEDSAKQLMSINALLLGVYVTVVINNLDKPFNYVSAHINEFNNSSISFFYRFNSTANLTAPHPPIMGNGEFLRIALIEVLFLLPIPAYFWTKSIINSMKALEPMANSEQLLDDNISSNFLLYVANKKFLHFKKASKFTSMGLLSVIMGFFMLVMVLLLYIFQNTHL